jgi:CheY-like chemotaxis protein
MFAPHELDRLSEPRLDALAALAPTTAERPAAMMALGLARAWFIADRIVWRIAAHAEESDIAGPFAGATRVVAVESGERYWVLEPAWLLRGVVPAALPPAPRPRPEGPAPAIVPSPRAPEPVAPAPLAHEALAEAAERALESLRGERAAAQRAAAAREALAPVAPARPVPPAPDDAAALVDAAFTFDAGFAPGPLAPAEATPPPAELTGADAVLFGRGPLFEATRLDRPSEVAEHTPERRALIADDSLVARIFLGRLLEQRGWIVESVEDAAGLWNELRHGAWTLVCADFALPDATGRSHVQRLVDHFGRSSRPATLVVLTRDEEEERIALEAGATLSLRKPFDPVRLDSLLAG